MLGGRRIHKEIKEEGAKKPCCAKTLLSKKMGEEEIRVEKKIAGSRARRKAIWFKGRLHSGLAEGASAERNAQKRNGDALRHLKGFQAIA